MTLSVAQRISLLASAGILSLVVIVGGVYNEVRQVRTKFDALSHLATVQRGLAHADMMHDALRGDVLAAALASVQHDAAELKQAAAEAAEHSKEFSDNIAVVLGHAPTADIAAKAKDLAAPLNAYLTGADAVVRALVAAGFAPKRMPP